MSYFFWIVTLSLLAVTYLYATDMLIRIRSDLADIKTQLKGLHVALRPPRPAHDSEEPDSATP